MRPWCNQEEELEERRIAAIYAEEDRQANVLEQKILREFAGAELSSKAEIKERRIVEAANRKLEQVGPARCAFPPSLSFEQFDFYPP
eukprot:COSAG03_NODE_10874_length_624_cov_1.028571_1_plen_87_part_00